jgi:Predicted acyltransferases
MPPTDHLTGWRFLAAIIVVIFHFGRHLPWVQAFPLLAMGPPMVTLFFVLSGFVLAWRYASLAGDVDWCAYAVARMARILPLYFLALAVCAGLGHFQQPFSGLLNGFLLQAWVPFYALTGNGPGWSISVEVFFYALFPWLVTGFLGSRGSAMWLLVLTGTVFVMVQSGLIWLRSSSAYHEIQPSVPHELIFYFPLSHLPSFLMGVWVGAMTRNRQVGTGRVAWLFDLGFLLLLGLLVRIAWDRVAHEWRLGGVPLLYDASLLGPLFALMLYFSLFGRFVPRLFASRSWQVLGQSSYAIYIMQVPIHELLTRNIAVDWSTPSFFLVYLLILSVTGMWLNRCVEQPLNKRLRALRASEPLAVIQSKR